jgi:HPt (histidine-containing phosphotransfer) domain-containing protein
VNAIGEQDTFVLPCDGSLTLANAEQWRERLLDALDRHPRVVVDVAGAEEIDTTFIQILVAAKKSAAIAGKRIGVYPASARLDSANIDTKDFPVRETVRPSIGVPAAAAASASADDVDRAAIDTLIGEIGADAVRQSLDVFFGEIAARLSTLTSYAGETHNAAVARETHLLKGTAGTFGLKRLAAEVSAFERQSADFGPAAYTAALNGMTETLRRSQSAILAMMTPN